MKRCAGWWKNALLLLSIGCTALVGGVQAQEHGAAPGGHEAVAAPAGHAATPAPHDAEPGHETPGGHDAAGEPGAVPSGHEAAAGHGEAAAHGGHGATHDPSTEAFHTAESSSIVDLILKANGYRKPEEGQPDPNSRTLQTWAMFQMPILSGVVIILLMAVIVTGARRREMIPGKLQNLVEMIIGGFDEFVQGILGLEGRQFLPFLGTLFLYIWISNLIGLVPLMKSPTSSINTTIALALCVFLYVQYTGIRKNGIGGYLYHLAGEPKDAVGWGLVPLMLPLHVIGELAKPMSLSLRLFGNIFGEETLIAVMVGLGVGALAFLHVPIGIPFQVPFMLLSLLFSTIQALVFTLLATIYFSLMLPHHEHHDHHDARHGDKHAAGAAHH